MSETKYQLPPVSASAPHVLDGYAMIEVEGESREAEAGNAVPKDAAADLYRHSGPSSAS
jgi:hypothetical protein